MSGARLRGEVKGEESCKYGSTSTKKRQEKNVFCGHLGEGKRRNGERKTGDGFSNQGKLMYKGDL